MTSEEKTREQDPEEQPLKEKDEKGEEFQFENKTFFEKLCYLKSNITVEPIMAGLIIPSMLSRIAVQNLNLEKTCRIKLHLGGNICDALIKKEGNFTQYEGDIQKVIASIEAWKSIIQTALPTLLVIFMGAWSDRTGNRKIAILLPILGELLVCMSNITSTVFFNEISVEITMFLEAIFPAITGGWVMVYLGVFSYISDITDEKSRTFRVGLVNLCMTAGIPIGTALSGIMLNVLGYYGIFTISGSIYMITLVYGMIYLKSKTKPGAEDNNKSNPLTCSELVSLVKKTKDVAFKKREGNTRIKILLTLLVVAIIYGPNHGERIVFYYFLRYRLEWNAVKYSMYSTYSIITHSLGALFSISVFSKRWGFHDSLLCLISVVSKLTGSILIVFVQNDFQMFMIPIVEILNATTFTSLRSMASKLVPSEEMDNELRGIFKSGRALGEAYVQQFTSIGKMNSLFSLVETLAALMFDPTYSAVYYATVKIFAGAVFIFSSFMTLPAISILVWFFSQHRREAKQRRTQEKLKQSEIVVPTPEVVESLE